MDGRDLLTDLGPPLRVAMSDEERPAVPTRRPSFAALLVRAGLVSVEQIDDALAEGERSGQRLGEVLIRRGWTSEEDVARVLAQQSELPFLSPGSFSVDPRAMGVLPAAEARRIEACVVGFDRETPVVALVDPAGARINSLRQRLGEDTVFAIVTSTTLTELVDTAPIDDLVDDVSSMVTAPDPSQEIVYDVPSRVAAADPPQTADESETFTPRVDPGAILTEFDGLTATLHDSAETLNLLRARIEWLVETSAETSRGLDHCRLQLQAEEAARQLDRETIRQLEEQLAERTQVVSDMKTKLGDLMSGFEAVG